MKYIVTGVGRSGTGYMAQLLTNAGIPCGHEKIFKYDKILENTEKYEAESSWMALPYLERGHEVWKDCTVIHVVRSPWDVLRGKLFEIENMFNLVYDSKVKRPAQIFIEKSFPGIESFNSKLDAAIHFHVVWNERIDSLKAQGYKVIRVRVEDPDILKKLGIQSDISLPSTLINSRKSSGLKIEVVDNILALSTLYRFFLDQAEEYGYWNFGKFKYV